MNVYDINNLDMRGLLSQGARREHFSDKVDVSILGIDPRSVEFHDAFVF